MNVNGKRKKEFNRLRKKERMKGQIYQQIIMGDVDVGFQFLIMVKLIYICLSIFASMLIILILILTAFRLLCYLQMSFVLDNLSKFETKHFIQFTRIDCPLSSKHT